MATTDGTGPFGLLLQQYRAAAGLSQEELAERAGLSKRGISDLERGQRRSPHPATVRRLADALGLEGADRARLLARTHPPPAASPEIAPSLAEPRLPAAARAPESGAIPLVGRTTEWQQLKSTGQVSRAWQPGMVASEAPQHNLPLQPTSLIGRDKELVELAGALDKTRLITLTGVAGVGKTRLALAVAERIGGSYADGMWLVELAPLADAALVAQTVARLVAVPLAPGGDPVSALVNYFRPRQTLLILDNCEHLLAGCAMLSDALLRQCAHVQILATSREPLGVASELHWRVPSLAVPTDEPLAAAELRQYSAVELFVTRVQSTLPHFALTARNAQSVARICARLDGIPLALELAAGRARALPLDVIADRLDHRFHLLASGNRTAVPRQQTLAATLGWSHDLLTDEERRLFRRLAVFAGSWTLAAAERICAADDGANSDVLDVLTRLVDKSMVLVEDGASGVERYRLLETLRQYGEERLAESGEADAIRDRHFAYYLELVKTAHTEVAVPRRRDSWLQRLDDDNDNLRTALTWGSERDSRAALRLAVDLSWYWWLRRRYLEGVGWQEQLFDSAPGDAQLQARALAHIGLLAREYGDLERAQFALSEAKARFDALGDRRGQSHVLYTLTFMYLGQERLADAWFAAREHLRLNQELGDLARQVFGLAHLGLVATFDEDLLAARGWHEQSLRLARTLEDRFTIARLCCLLGGIRRLLGDYAGAAELFAEAGPLLDAMDPFSRARGWMLPADLAVDQGQYDRAAALYTIALRDFQRVGFRLWVDWVAQRLGIMAIRMGDQRRGVRILSARHDIDALALAAVFPELVYDRRRALEHARLVLGEQSFAAECSVGQTFTLEEAVLEGLNATAVQPTVSTADERLTPRQYEVAALIARGLTNGQISQQLVVSPHTIERHVENILDRLRLSSRIEIAVWMVEHARG
jgi:predicted ATPase/DNA-binding CsgD family transcriptional regulator/transcriptional regulator with XRE-family HTH domain